MGMAKMALEKLMSYISKQWNGNKGSAKKEKFKLVGVEGGAGYLILPPTQ